MLLMGFHFVMEMGFSMGQIVGRELGSSEITNTIFFNKI